MQTEQGLYKEHTVELRNNAKMRSDTKGKKRTQERLCIIAYIYFLQLNLNRSKDKNKLIAIKTK